MSVKKLFCNGWEFSKTPFGTEYSENFDWQKVDIPHDWLIYDTNNLYETSTGWYRKNFFYEKAEEKRASIRFDGVYMDSKVYANGTLVGEWKYGYSAFEFDITNALKQGENEIWVRVDHKSPNSRWYSGAGIFRDVWFNEYPDVHILSDGIYISAEIDGTLTASVEIERPKGVQVGEYSVRNVVKDGQKVKSQWEFPCTAVSEISISQAIRQDNVSYSVNTNTVKIENPILWDIDNPHLYTLETYLLKNGEIIDSEITKFGFRKAEFTCDKGFFLNNKHLKLHGCCEHHDLGALGAAFNENAMRRKLVKLRKMGINSIRTSHNMPAKQLLELADEMGFLILCEGFDMWEMPKTEFDYARFFKEWVAKDVASWVRRDRNHPCLIGWSLGNEIYDTHASDHGQEIASQLKTLVRQHDSRENGIVTIGSNYMQWEGAQKCADIVKVAGYNYAERLYDEHHKKYPDWKIYGSETSSVVQSRGIYHFPLETDILCEDDEQCSALGNSHPSWSAKSYEDCILPDRDAEFCAGQYIWTGFDYIGEPTPYSTKNSYFGQYDTAGFPKDSVYVFRSMWTDYKKCPFVHIFPYWDFYEGQKVDVRVASNAPEVELFLNGKSVLKKKFDRLCGKEITLDAKLCYEKGELLAIAYDENGVEIARDVRKSFGDAEKIKLLPENTQAYANGRDLIFVEISAFDKDGNHVYNANNRIFVEVAGEGRLLGLDNGDSTDYDQYKGTSRRLFSGKLLAIIGTTKNAGKITLKVTSPEIEGDEMVFETIPCEICDGISCDEFNQPCVVSSREMENDIPTRRIELVSDKWKFTPDCDTITFKTKVYPENSSYKREIDYRVTSATGIDTNLAEIVEKGDDFVTVKCKGDGIFFIRALCKNGTDKYHVLNAFEVSGEGLGFASFDPYEFVTGGLFTKHQGEITNGVDRGAGFARENSWIAFEEVDFGKIGSDTVTVPIYANCTTPVVIRFYDGIPAEGGELVGEFTYHEEPIWLTYIPNTFKLSKKFKGVHTFVMESSDGFEVGGFTFEKPIKETAELFAVDNDSIYGDKFEVKEDAVYSIGNNVTLAFGEFDFTKKAPTGISVTGKSELPLNSIHIVFEGDTEKRVLLEFEKAEKFTSRTFPLDEISGECKVSFVFLPGSDFDFKSFKFEY